MRAMIMAAGKGTRLRPITDLIPKPMAPIANRPALYHILRLLERHGIREVVINLHHLPEAITGYFGDGAWMDMSITYSFEEELLGTAGGVKNNEDFLSGDTFLVMSGDSLTDLDLTSLIAAHRRRRSVATLAVKEVADPSHYGVVVADDDDRVIGFQEKPSRDEARSRLCNCGIYVFEPEIFSHILPAQFDDFGSRVFPDLLRHRVPFHLWAGGGYWSDVGNLNEYIRGNQDALLGRVEVQIPGREIRPGVWIDQGSSVAASVSLQAPVVIGSGCHLEDDVVVEGPAVLGEGCSVGKGAHIVRGLVLPGSRVVPGSLLVEGVMGQRVGAGE